MSDCGGALAKLVLRKMHTKTSLMKLKFPERKAVHDCYQCWKFELKISSDSGDMHFSANKPRWGGCLMLVTWDTGVSVHESISAIVVMANMANTGKTVQVVRWSSRKRRVVQAPAEPRTKKWFFPDPSFPPKSPKMGQGQFFPPLTQKCQLCFTQEIKGNLNFAPKAFQTKKTNW